MGTVPTSASSASSQAPASPSAAKSLTSKTEMMRKLKEALQTAVYHYPAVKQKKAVKKAEETFASAKKNGKMFCVPLYNLYT